MMMLQATSETGDRSGEPQGPPDTVQSLQHEIEVIKAKIAQEREKIRVRSEISVRMVKCVSRSGQNTAASGGHRQRAEH